MFLAERFWPEQKNNNNNKYRRKKERKKTNKIVQYKHSSDNKKERHTCAINVLIAKEKELKSYVLFLYK